MDTLVKLIAAAALGAARAALAIVHVFVSSLIQAAASLWREVRTDWERLSEASSEGPESRG